jgi:hypothetical protein
MQRLVRPVGRLEPLNSDRATLIVVSARRSPRRSGVRSGAVPRSVDIWRGGHEHGQHAAGCERRHDRADAPRGDRRGQGHDGEAGAMTGPRPTIEESIEAPGR